MWLSDFPENNVFKVHSCCGHIRISFLFKAESFSTVCIDHIIFIQSYAKRHGLFTSFGYCEQCCFKYGCINTSLAPAFNYSVYIPAVKFLNRMEILLKFWGTFLIFVFSFPPYFLPSCLHFFHFLSFFLSLFLLSFFCISYIHYNDENKIFHQAIYFVHGTLMIQIMH